MINTTSNQSCLISIRSLVSECRRAFLLDFFMTNSVDLLFLTETRLNNILLTNVSQYLDSLKCNVAVTDRIVDYLVWEIKRNLHYVRISYHFNCQSI